MKGRLTTSSILLGFLVVISLFLGPRIYLDHTILVGDGLYYTDPTFQAVGGRFFNTTPTNFLMGVDNTLEGYPHRYFVQTALARGEIPRWNPYIGMGMPFAGLGVLEPVSALVGLFAPPTKLPNFKAVAGLWIAATGMWMFLGTLGLSRLARIFGAVAFAFSGWTVVWLGRHNFLTEIWMPWLFLAAERLVRTPAVGRVGVLALFSALICLPAHFQTSFHIFAAVGVYVLIRTVWTGETARRRAAIVLAFALAVALGVTVGLAQIVPMAELVGQSDLPPQGRGKQLPANDPVTTVWYGIRGNWALAAYQGPTILTMVSPLFFGTPLKDTYWWPWGNFAETMMYVGLLPLFFALYGFARRREIPGMGRWLALTLLSVGIAYGLPILNLVNYLPGFNLINNGRLRLVYRFAVAVTAALGFDRFTAASDQRTARARLPWIAWYAAAVPGLITAAYLALTSLNVDMTNLSEIWARTIQSLEKAQTPAAGIALAAFVGAGFAFSFRRYGVTIFRSAVVVITVAELFWFLHGFNPSIPSKYVFPETPVVQFLKSDSSLFRVSSTSLGDIMPPNTKLPYDIFDVDLYSILVVDRYAALQAAVNGPLPPGHNPAYRAFRFSDPATHRGLINLMNVKYFVIPARGRDGAGGLDPFRSLAQYRLVYDREVKIYQNLEALPRAFLVDRAVILDAPAAVLDAVTRPDFDPAFAGLLEDPTSPRLALPDPVAPDAGAAEILSLTPNRVVVRARARQPAYLVLSEVYYPGWRAWVDGTETSVYRADYLFRAVHLEAGLHDVVFTFMPRSYMIAGAFSVAAALVVGSCLVWDAAASLKRMRFPTSPRTPSATSESGGRT